MKIVVLIMRLLLGVVFLVFGLNAFLQFLKGPIPGGLAGQFLQSLFQFFAPIEQVPPPALGGESMQAASSSDAALLGKKISHYRIIQLFGGAVWAWCTTS